MPELIRPHERFKDSYLEAAHEFGQSVAESTEIEPRELAYLHNRFADGDLEWLSSGDNFESFVNRMLSDTNIESPRPMGWVPSTWLWLIDGDDFVGSLDIRHVMTEFLITTGGALGYDIRPSRRGHGLGRVILRLALPFANQLGYDPVLVTCSPRNKASEAVIRANGGVFEDERNDRLRFWVPTS